MTLLTRITSPADLFKCDTSYYLLLHLKRTERDAGDTDKMLLNKGFIFHCQDAAAREPQRQKEMKRCAKP